MKVALTGTRGVPNNYGGFEQFAGKLASGLVRRDHEVIVYNPGFHPFREGNYKGAQIIRKRSPEKLIGPVANYIYDFRFSWDLLSSSSNILLHVSLR